jgi:PAS domain S-box-containing protein
MRTPAIARRSEPSPQSWWRALRDLKSPRQSIPAKFLALVLAITAVALLLAGVAMLSYDLTVYRRSWAADLTTQAAILARSTAPALAFDDRPTAQLNLSALQAREEILGAALYGRDGMLYARYQRGNEDSLPAQLSVSIPATEMAGNKLELTHRIERNGEFLGTIYLRARYDVTGRVKAYVTIFALVTAVSLIAALVLSAVLQRLITAPLNAVASIARLVIEGRDYSRRALKVNNDEIGVMVDAFNNMLDEVQTRTDALEKSNNALQQEITMRQDVESALRASEKLYRAIGESIDYGVWVCDAAGRNIYVSDSFLQLVGLNQDQCSNKGWGEALHPDDAAATIADWNQCVQTGDSWYREHRFIGKDGVYHPVLARGVPIRDDSGELLGWAGINLDISRIKLTEEALRDADRRKDEFLATLAHELRNPLAPIRHATKILDTSVADEKQRSWARDVITRQVQHMSLLLDDLLDVSRITRGRLELKRSGVDLVTLVNSAIETVQPLVNARRHRLQVSLPEHSVQLQVDALRISQALSNLLTNAAKYTDDGGTITVTATIDEYVTIAVHDTGIGISTAAIPKIFDMFSQVESVVDRSQGGLGIGLALVKGLVTAHGGFVVAKSEGLGRGSTFSIHLPHSTIVPAPARIEPTETNDGTKAPACKVLIADDNRDSALSLGMVLEMSGHIVHVAHTGREALTIGAREKPDACILDIGMPELNGYETARHIRREVWGTHALLIAVTGWGQSDDKDKARDAGFDRHFTKPVNLSEIERTLEQFAKHL